MTEMEGAQARQLLLGIPKRRARWVFDSERMLIGLWAIVLCETNGKMITRKKEVVVTKHCQPSLVKIIPFTRRISILKLMQC